MVIIILGSLKLIKRKEEVNIDGQENNQICIKANFLKGNAMEEALFGGLMAVGMKVNFEMVYRVDMGFFVKGM
jgi:hypothetical protein